MSKKLLMNNVKQVVDDTSCYYQTYTSYPIEVTEYSNYFGTEDIKGKYSSILVSFSKEKFAPIKHLIGKDVQNLNLCTDMFDWYGVDIVNGEYSTYWIRTNTIDNIKACELLNTELSKNSPRLCSIHDSYITEIYGNTWQDKNNLSDIRHVGALQDDGTYKIDINVNDEVKKSIFLPQPLRKIGDYCDRLYWDDILGKYCIEQNIFGYTTPSDIDVVNNNLNVQNVIGINNLGKNIIWSTSTNTLCNIIISGLQYIVWGVNQSSLVLNKIYYGTNSNGTLTYYINPQSTLTNEEINSAFSNKEVCFVIEPEIIETNISEKISLTTPEIYIKITTDEMEVSPSNMSAEVSMEYEETEIPAIIS